MDDDSWYEMLGYALPTENSQKSTAGVRCKFVNSDSSLCMASAWNGMIHHGLCLLSSSSSSGGGDGASILQDGEPGGSAFHVAPTSVSSSSSLLFVSPQ